jgi:hypothetical protein
MACELGWDTEEASRQVGRYQALASGYLMEG